MSNVLEQWFENKRFGPLKEWWQSHDTLDRIFHEMVTLTKKGESTEFNFKPTCEIYEEGNNYILRFDMPGVTKENLKVEADNDQLTVQAERRDDRKPEDRRKYLSEIFYGSYTRSFTLPGPMDEKKVDAVIENGVLTITVPKSETAKAKLIPVH